MSGEMGEFRYTQFWVQAFKIPTESMIGEVGHIMGRMIGEVLEVEVDERIDVLGRICRSGYLLTLLNHFVGW